MCDCINVEVGSYDNQVMLKRPEHMKGQTEGSANQQHICVDKCLEIEIKHLWHLKISTTGCCCGHNKLPPFIGVISSDIEKMKSMGYEVQPNPLDLSRQDGFKPKTVNH